jgi:hypothetical protein
MIHFAIKMMAWPIYDVVLRLKLRLSCQEQPPPTAFTQFTESGGCGNCGSASVVAVIAMPPMGDGREKPVARNGAVLASEKVVVWRDEQLIVTIWL